MDITLSGTQKPEREEVIEPLVEPRRRDEPEKPEREVGQPTTKEPVRVGGQ